MTGDTACLPPNTFAKGLGTRVEERTLERDSTGKSCSLFGQRRPPIAEPLPSVDGVCQLQVLAGMPLRQFCYIFMDWVGPGFRVARVEERRMEAHEWPRGQSLSTVGSSEGVNVGEARQYRREGALREGMGGMPMDPLLIRMRCLPVGCRCRVRVLVRGVE
jgi:hypothetical protein